MPFIIIITCVGLYFVYISPSIADINSKKARYEEYQNVLNKVQEITTKKDELSSAYNNISEINLDRLNKIIPEKFNDALFANDINSMASASGVVLNSVLITPTQTDTRIVDQTEVSDEPYKRISGQLEVSGRFDQILNFIKGLESSLQLIDVVNINVLPGGSEGSSRDMILTYSIEFVTYSLK